MRTKPTLDLGGTKVVSFSIPSFAFVGLGGVEKVLRGVEGVEIVRRRRLLRLSEEVHFEFRFRSATCVVWEPWGDSSEFVVLQTGGDDPVDLTPIETAFRGRQWWRSGRPASPTKSTLD